MDIMHAAGEDRGDVLIGMGAKGAPLLDELAARLASKSGGGQTVINNFYGKSLLSNSEMADFARKFYPSQVKEQQRRGIN